MAFLGCVLVSGLGGAVSPAGLIYGLCAGLGYALYSIFARLALIRGYDGRTINFYACLLCTLGATVIWGGAEPVTRIFASGGSIFWSLATGVVSCYLPYLLYTYGLSGMETGKASVMASVEPVVATLVGLVVYRERLSLMSAGGIVLVLGAVVLLNLKKQPMPLRKKLKVS
jgi:drug/metabolite transporter (DMT)-like permease